MSTAQMCVCLTTGTKHILCPKPLSVNMMLFQGDTALSKAIHWRHLSVADLLLVNRAVASTEDHNVSDSNLYIV